MIKHLLNNQGSGITLSFILLLTGLLIPLSIDDGRYILLSLFVLAYLIWLFVDYDHKVRLPKAKYLVPIFGFGLLAISSSLWVEDTSQSLRHSFIWALFLLYLLIISIHHERNEHFSRQVAKLFSCFFVFLLALHLGALNFEIALYGEWNELMSKGKNYSTTLLTVLVPYLLFYPSKSQFIRFAKIISVILLANVLFLTGTRGALLAFAVIVLIKLWNFYSHTPWRILGGIGGLSLIIAAIYFLNVSQASTDFLFVNEYRQELESRIRMNKNSIKSISERPLFGVGAGHWARDIYRHGIADVSPFNSTTDIIRYRSHNAYFMIAVEYGLIGFVLFFLPIVLCLLRYRHKWTDLDGIQKAAWVSLAAWLIVIFFYATAVPYSFFFSGIALVGLTGYALLLPYSDTKPVLGRYTLIGTAILATLCAIWFSFSKVCHSTFQKANRAYENEEFELAFRLYEQLYHPYFFASVDYRVSLDQKLAEAAAKIENHNKVVEHYERGLAIMPYSTDLLFSYLNYLRAYDVQSDRIPEVEQRIKKIQDNLR